MDWTSHAVEANGITLHYYRGGKTDALPIIMLHGITDSGLCWDRVARVLAADYDMILLDARGHGQSDKPESGYGYPDHAADVAGVIDALDLAPPIVFGHSMGAGTATVLAARHPDRVRALVLEDPAWIDAPQSDAERDQRLNDWKTSLSESKALSVEALAAKQAAEAPTWDESELRPWAESKHAVSLNVLELVNHPRLVWRDTVPAIQCPFLLITAEVERGAIISPDVAAEVGKMPQAQVVHISGAGHNIRREQYDHYMAVVTAFLQGL
jgi:N-formylmaleamate deformylase